MFVGLGFSIISNILLMLGLIVGYGCGFDYADYCFMVKRRQGIAKCYEMITLMPGQVSHLNRLCLLRDSDCLSNLRMDQNTFAQLCILLRDLRGLTNQKYAGVEEQVSMFLSVLAHHKKQSVVKFDYQRSGQTVSRYVHLVLKAVLKLNYLILVTLTLVPDDSGFLDALDGIYINAQVSSVKKIDIEPGRVMSPLMCWECVTTTSATMDMQTLSAFSQRIELLHNFICREMPYDPIEEQADQVPLDDSDTQPPDIIDIVESSIEFNIWQEELALSMHDIWRARGYVGYGVVISMGSHVKVAYIPCLDLVRIQRKHTTTMTLKNIPSQDSLLYNRKWIRQMDEIFLETLCEQQKKGYVNDTLDKDLSWEDVIVRRHFLEDHFDAFNLVTSTPNVWWDQHYNIIHADDSTWLFMMKHDKLARAYYYRGELEYEMMKVLSMGSETHRSMSSRSYIDR
ncbi:hypothetical protein ACS0TY_027260 [Phlomoides rotata]